MSLARFAGGRRQVYAKPFLQVRRPLQAEVKVNTRHKCDLEHVVVNTKESIPEFLILRRLSIESGRLLRISRYRKLHYGTRDISNDRLRNEHLRRPFQLPLHRHRTNSNSAFNLRLSLFLDRRGKVQQSLNIGLSLCGPAVRSIVAVLAVLAVLAIFA